MALSWECHERQHLIKLGMSNQRVSAKHADDQNIGRLRRAAQGVNPMHDLLIALAFIGMVIAPAIVAAKAGSNTGSEGN
jgi:hypothetical protein